jgi:hypothetical protein
MSGNISAVSSQNSTILQRINDQMVIVALHSKYNAGSGLKKFNVSGSSSLRRKRLFPSSFNIGVSLVLIVCHYAKRIETYQEVFSGAIWI